MASRQRGVAVALCDISTPWADCVFTLGSMGDSHWGSALSTLTAQSHGRIAYSPPTLVSIDHASPGVCLEHHTKTLMKPSVAGWPRARAAWRCRGATHWSCPSSSCSRTQSRRASSLGSNA